MDIRLVKRESFSLYGYSVETCLATCSEDIARLWQDYSEKGKANCGTDNGGHDLYGLMWMTDKDRYCYMFATEIPPSVHTSTDLTQKIVPAEEYAVVCVPSSISAMDAWTEFYEEALPAAGLKPAPAHLYDFEYYPKDGTTYELWTPVIHSIP